MSKIEMLIYVAMAVFIMAVLPLDEVPTLCIAGIGFAGSLLGIVAWNVLNESWRDEE